MITRDELTRLLTFDGKEFRWRRPRGPRLAGSLAGMQLPDGRVIIKLNGRLYQAGQLAALWYHKAWPKRVMFIDRDPTNLHHSNLRINWDA